MSDEEVAVGIMGPSPDPIRLEGHKKRNGEYVLPKKVVEFHGEKGIRQFISEAEWGLQEEEWRKDEKSKTASKKKKTKTVFAK